VRTPVHVVMPGVLPFCLCQPSLLLGKQSRDASSRRE